MVLKMVDGLQQDILLEEIFMTEGTGRVLDRF